MVDSGGLAQSLVGEHPTSHVAWQKQKKKNQNQTKKKKKTHHQSLREMPSHFCGHKVAPCEHLSMSHSKH